MKRHIITEFKHFIEKYETINEGGGAGKEFTFPDFSYRLSFTYNKNGITNIKSEVDCGETFNLRGYADGLSNILVDDMFSIIMLHNIDTKAIDELTLRNLEYNTGDKIFVGDDKTTLKEIVNRGEEINIDIEGSGKLEKMHGAGWTLQIIKSNDSLVLDVEDFIGLDYRETLNGINTIDLFYKIVDIKFEFTFLEKFEQLWNDLFNRDDYEDEDGDGDDYYNYLEDMYTI